MRIGAIFATSATLAAAASGSVAAPPAARAALGQPTPPVQVLVTPSTPGGTAAAAVAAAGGRVQTREDGTLQALVPPAGLVQLAASPAVGDVSRAPVATADVVVSQGVLRMGADAFGAGPSGGSGLRIAVLDQAFGDPAKLDSLAGTELPPLERQHRRSFDATYGLVGRDYNGSASRHGEFVTELVYDSAPAADYWLVNYRTSLEFDQAVDYLVDEVRPDIVVHSNSFLFGPFDGSGWFAQRVDRAAEAGILWVNSAGNYRTRHWEGAWADGNADGSLDVPGLGDAMPVTLVETDKPSCDISWANPDPTGAEGYYSLGLFVDAAGTLPAIDRVTGQPIQSSFVADPEPHSSIPPPNLPDAGAYYLRVRRVGSPSTTHVTLFCRAELPSVMQVPTSSLPTPGDARGALAVGAFHTVTLEPEVYSSEGPTDDGRPKPDLAAATNVQITERYCGGTSCAAPHVAGAAALVWPWVAGGPGKAARVAELLEAQALDAGAPGFDYRFGAGRVRLDLAAPRLGTTAPLPNARVAGFLAVALPFEEAGTLAPVTVALDAVPISTFTGEDKVIRGVLDTRVVRDGPHTIHVAASDFSGNAAAWQIPLTTDNTGPAVALRAGRRTLTGRPFRVSASVADPGSGLVERPRILYGDGATSRGTAGAHIYRQPGWRTVAVEAEDRTGNTRRVAQGVQVEEFRLAAVPGSLLVELGRPSRVRVVVRRGKAKPVRSVLRSLKAGTTRIPLGPIHSGRYRVLVEVRGTHLAKLLFLRR